jgi:hypothetical protein
LKASEKLQLALREHISANPSESASSLHFVSIWTLPGASEELDRRCDEAEPKSLALVKKHKLKPRGRPDLAYGMTIRDDELWFHYETTTERPKT